jgi:hypothetical protein
MVFIWMIYDREQTMSKAYWRSAGGGALGMAGPWRSAGQSTVKRVSVWRRIEQVALSTFLLAFGSGVVIGLYQTWWSGRLDARDAALFAYRSVGQTIDGCFAWVVMLSPMTDHATATPSNILFYLEIPYQLCAFAGAYAATAGIEFLAQLAAIVSAHL